MAALLCEGIGKLCLGLCKGCETICCSPLKAINNPFCITVTTAIAFSVPPIVSSLESFSEFSPIDGCTASMWLLGNTVFCSVNIAGAMYIAMKFKSTARGQDGFNRATHVLCHDPGVALYILALIGFFIWLCMGVSWSMDNECIGDYDNAISVSIGCGFTFLVVGSMSLCCSICCSCCYREQDDTLYSVPNTNNYGTNAAMAATGGNDIESIPIAVATPVGKAGPTKGAPTVSQTSKKPSPSAPSADEQPTLAETSKVKFENAKLKTSEALNNGLESMKKFLKKK